MNLVKWRDFDSGSTIGKEGSEGIIERDLEVVIDGEPTARFTIEDTGAGKAIVCGVYGNIVHTVYLYGEKEKDAEVSRGIRALLEVMSIEKDPVRMTLFCEALSTY